MGAVIKLLQAIRNLTKAGSIKSIEQAYQLAKRELGDRFNTVKKQIDDAFNQGKKEQTLDKRTKDIKKTEESGIKSLETDNTGTAKKLTDDEIFALESDKIVGDTKDSTPLMERLAKAVEEGKKQIEEIGSLSDADMQKKQIQDALRSLRDKRIYEMASGREGDVRTALRQFLQKELETGKLDIPDAYERKMIAEVRQGGVDPIDVFRKAYGEDALIAVDDIFEQYGDRLRGPTYRDIEENFRKLFKMNRGFYDMADLPVPKKEYGFEPGLQSVDSLEEELMKQYRQLDELDKFEPSTKRKPNAEGGLMRTSYAVGSGIKLAVFLARKGKDLMTEIKKAVDNIMSSGDSKYDADVAVDNMLDDLNIDRDAIDQKDVMDAYGKAYNMLAKERGLMSTKVPGGMTPGSSDMDRLKELGAPKLAERFELKQKYPGITDDLLDKILADDNPQRKAEVLASIDEAFRMMEKGKDPDEIIDILEQGKKTRKDNATGGRAGYQTGGITMANTLAQNKAINKAQESSVGQMFQTARQKVLQRLQANQPKSSPLETFGKHAMVSEAMKGKTGMDVIPEYGLQTGADFQMKFPGVNPKVSAGLAAAYQTLQEGSRAILDGPGGVTLKDAYNTAVDQTGKNIEGILAADTGTLTAKQQANRNKYLASQGQPTETTPTPDASGVIPNSPFRWKGDDLVLGDDPTPITNKSLREQYKQYKPTMADVAGPAATQDANGYSYILDKYGDKIYPTSAIVSTYGTDAVGNSELSKAFGHNSKYVDDDLFKDMVLKQDFVKAGTYDANTNQNTGYASGGRVRAASGGLAGILKL